MNAKKLLGMAILIFASLSAHGDSRTIEIGQIAPLSGPASSIGTPVTQATHAYFRKVNQNGGVGGYKLELLDRDDGFDPTKTASHVRSLIAESAIVALINVIGAPNNGELVTSGILHTNSLPVVGAFTGSTSVRQNKSPLMYFVRASVADEAKKMVAQLKTLGVSQIGLFHANDAFGLDAKTHVESAIKEIGGVLSGVASYEPATVDANSAAAKLKVTNAQAILLFGTGPASSKFVTEYRKLNGRAILIANSSTSPEVLATYAKDYARGVGLVQVVPSLKKLTIPVVSEYLTTLKRYGDKDWTPSPYGLEGFLAAKVLVEGLKRSAQPFSRESLVKALSSLGKYDTGGITLDYSQGSREGLKSVDIGIYSTSGKLLN